MEERRNLAEQKCWHNYLILTLLMLILDVTKAFPVAELRTEAPYIRTTTYEPPKPFHYKYATGRVPGDSGRPDRYVEQEGDGTGQIRGSYTYLDPNWTWQTVSENCFFLDKNLKNRHINYSYILSKAKMLRSIEALRHFWGEL